MSDTVAFSEAGSPGTWEMLRALTPAQRNAAVASYLGWMLDAFDFFILVMVMRHVAKDFQTTKEAVTYAILLTLAMRPLGALCFGLLADRFGRRPTLMFNIAFFSVMELLSGFAPSLTFFLVGGGCVAGDGNDPTANARCTFRHFATGLPGWLSTGGRGL